MSRATTATSAAVDRFLHPRCLYRAMTWDSKVLSALRRADVETVAYLPDGAVAPLVERIETADDLTAVRVTREEQAVGVLSGAWLGGQRGALVCQSSGLANTLNAVGSLNLPARIPFLGVVTRRGDLGEFNLAQVPFGYNGPRILDEMGVRNRSIEADDDVERTVEAAARSAYSTAEPYVLWLESSLTGAKDEF